MKRDKKNYLKIKEEQTSLLQKKLDLFLDL